MKDNIWKIMRIRQGQTPRDAAGFLGGAHAKEEYNVTFWCWAVWNETHKILIDTGIHPEDEHPWYTNVPIKIAPEEKLPVQLKEHLGWEPEDVDIVIHTHLHYDHAGNDYLFKNAKFIIQRDEFEYGMNCPETGFGFAFNKKRYDKNAVPYFNWILLDGEEQVLPGIICFPTHGHTVGHQSILINTEEGAICITGDAVNCKVSIDEDFNAGPLTSGWEQKESYKQIRQVAQRIISSHDINSVEVYDHQTRDFPLL